MTTTPVYTFPSSAATAHVLRAMDEDYDALEFCADIAERIRWAHGVALTISAPPEDDTVLVTVPRTVSPATAEELIDNAVWYIREDARLAAENEARIAAAATPAHAIAGEQRGLGVSCTCGAVYDNYANLRRHVDLREQASAV